jgi:hypothetical protein
MLLSFVVGLFLGVVVGVAVTGILTAGKFDDIKNGRDTPK